MREKILHLMSLTLPSFDEAIDNFAEYVKGAFFVGAGEVVVPEFTAVAETLKAAMRAEADTVRDQLAAFYETQFTAEEVDAQIAYEEGIGKRIREVSLPIRTATNQIMMNWQERAMKSIEPALTKIFGTPIAEAYPESAETIAAASAPESPSAA